MSAVERLHEVRAQLASKDATTESLALAAGTLSFIVVALVAWPVLGAQHLAIAGPGSLGEYVAFACSIVAAAAFVAGRVFSATHHLDASGRPMVTGVEGPVVGATVHRSLRILDVAVLAVAHGIIFLLLWIGLADLLEMGFQGAEVFTIPALILSGAGAAVSAYFSDSSAAGMNTLRLSGVLLLFLVVGALTSMITSTDPDCGR